MGDTRAVRTRVVLWLCLAAACNDSGRDHPRAHDNVEAETTAALEELGDKCQAGYAEVDRIAKARADMARFTDHGAKLLADLVALERRAPTTVAPAATLEDAAVQAHAHSTRVAKAYEPCLRAVAAIDGDATAAKAPCEAADTELAKLLGELAALRADLEASVLSKHPIFESFERADDKTRDAWTHVASQTIASALARLDGCPFPRRPATSTP